MMVPMPKAGPAVAKVAGKKSSENFGYIRRTLSPTHPDKTGLKAASENSRRVAIRCATARSGSPRQLWDYCGWWVGTVRRLTAHDNPKLQGCVPAEVAQGHTPNISE
jgi:hypothetical protein